MKSMHVQRLVKERLLNKEETEEAEGTIED
jgi:hypothetical protein